MSALTKKKHVYQESENNYELPKDNQKIVKVKSPRGNNLHDVVTPDNEEFIVTMPTKFRKTVWVKRGDYLIVQSIEEGNKVKAEIVQILNKDNIRYLKSQGVWPKEFTTNDEESNSVNGIPNDMLPPSSSSSSNSDDSENDENDNETSNNMKNKINNQNRKNLFNNNFNKLPT